MKCWTSKGKKFYCDQCKELMPKFSKHQTVCNICKEGNQKIKARIYKETMEKAFTEANKKFKELSNG